MVHPDASALPPSPWVMRFAPLVATGGRVLDLACGAGRHGMVFAAAGHKVTFVDRDTAALTGHLARQGLAFGTGFGADCAVLARDLEDGQPWALGQGCYQAVVVTNYLYRPHLPALFDALAEGGVLIYETFALGNESYGKPSNPDFLLRPGELLQAVPPSCSVVAYEHGLEHRSQGPRVIQRLCAQRGTAPQSL